MPIFNEQKMFFEKQDIHSELKMRLNIKNKQKKISLCVRAPAGWDKLPTFT